MKKINQSLNLLLLLSFFLSFAFDVGAADVAASVSRNPIGENESVELLFESKTALDGEPDFSGLETEFEIVNRNQSQSFQLINGDMSRSITWRLTLLPKRSGELKIPVIKFGNSQSAELKLVVNKASVPEQAKNDQPLFVKMVIDPVEAYVQQQILLKVQLYRSVNISNASLSTPTPSDSDIIIKQLGKDNQFETQENGVRYLVTERQYLLYPQKSGSFTIPGVQFQGEVLLNSQGQRGLFRQFRQRGEIRRVMSNPVELKVLPMPRQFTSDPWLPSGNLVLAEAWPIEQPKFVVGEPVTRTLMLMADGIPASQLPELNRALTAGVKQYPDQPLLEDKEGPQGVTGIRQEKIAIIPTQAGQLELPALEIQWWNTGTNQLETARIESQTIQVVANPSAVSPPSMPPQYQSEKPTSVDTTDEPQETAISQATAYPVWLILFLAGGWIITAIAWWFSSRSKTIAVIPAKSAKAHARGITREFRAACQSDDPEIASKALIGWAKSRWPDNPPLSNGEIALRIDDPNLIKALQELDKVLYAPQPSTWHGGELIEAISSIEKFRIPAMDKGSVIPPLNPAIE